MPAANEADYFQSIRTALSQARFESYRVSQGDDDLQLLARHLWNQALGAALYPTLQFLELALRNAMNTAITNAYGATWFDDPLVVVNVIYAQDRVKRAKQAVIDRTGYNPPSVNKVIAELDFGFWTSLFSHEYFAGRQRPANQKAYGRCSCRMYSPLPLVPVESPTNSRLVSTTSACCVML